MFKVFEIMASKGMGTVYSKRQELQEKLDSIRVTIFGYNNEFTGLHVDGKKDVVGKLFDELKDIPFSEPSREAFKKNTLREKRYLDKLFKQLKDFTSQINQLGDGHEE